MLTPAIFYLLAHQWLDISASAMLMDILKIVMLPIVLGVLCNLFLHRQTKAVEGVLPLVSVVSIALIIGAVVALNRTKIAEAGGLIFGVVMLHNCIGYLLGFFRRQVHQTALRRAKNAGHRSRDAEFRPGRRFGDEIFRSDCRRTGRDIQRVAQYFRFAAGFLLGGKGCQGGTARAGGAG